MTLDFAVKYFHIRNKRLLLMTARTEQKGTYFFMIVMTKIVFTLILVVILLRKRVQIGHAMLAGSILLYFLASPTLEKAALAVQTTVLETSTWEVVLAMYFVMCLEHLLRTSGTIEGFMTSVKPLLRSDRVLLAVMPAFLGLLPSLGGAIFSAPMVEHASKNYCLRADHKSTINYWFRHIWEYSNPIIPGVLLASQISGIPLSTFVSSMAGYTVLTFFLGLIFLLRGKEFQKAVAQQATFLSETEAGIGAQAGELLTDRGPLAAKPSAVSWRYILLALGPIVFNIILVVFFHFSAALSMGLVVLFMIPILKLDKNKVVKMLSESFDKKLLWGIFSIMFFQHVLSASGLVQEMVAIFQSMGIPVVVMIGLSSLVVALLTGGPQGSVAVLFPILAALAPGDIQTATTAYIMAITGAMLSPAHLCLIVTGEYFKSDIFKSLRTILYLEGIVFGVVLLTHWIG
jgi:hypothetical protein